MTFLEIFLVLVFLHAIGDYPLQTSWMATTKSHKDPHPSGFPWYQSLTAHSIIHGGLVGIFTGMIFLAIAEFFVHWFVDYCKNEGLFGTNTDQFIHIACKFAWAAIFFGAIQ